MPIAKIQLPDGRIAKFEVPEGTTQEQVLEFAQKNLEQLAPSEQPVVATVDAAPQVRARDEVLAELARVQPTGDIARIQALNEELESSAPSVGDIAERILEPAATIATGAIAEPVAGIAGIAQSINPFAEPGAGARAVEATRGALTFQPRTEAGQAGLEAVGEALQPVGEAIQSVERGLGDVAFEATGSPAIAAAATALPTAILSAFPAAKIFKNAGKPTKAQLKIMSELKKNPANPNLADFAVQSGKPRRVAALKEAVRQSGSPELVAVMKSSSPADKAAFSEMIKNIQTAKVDPVFGDRVRVGDTVGKAL
jgi:hypothetical protein